MRGNRTLNLHASVLGGVLLFGGLGCGAERRVVEPPALTDAQVRELLQETLKTGDASSDLYMRFVKQLGSSARADAAGISNLVCDMVVENDPAKNRESAKKILEKW